MLDQEAITQQLTLLATHRRTLAHLMEQAAQYGGEVFAPPQTANGITEARQQIRRIKALLRKHGVQIEDAPNDKAPRQRKVAQSQQAGEQVSGDKLAGDKVGGDKVMGDKRNVTTQGGDYAEGNIDKRQGTFIDKQIIQPALAPALHQLRAPIGDFVGREHEIDQLVQALSKATSGGAAAAISGVRGMGGIGKTELAYAAAQQLSARFPDAQLLLELRGAGTDPLTPQQALQTVIRAFEREAKLPDDLSDLRNIYCSVLAGKNALILADDAKDAAQVRALLPPVGCALLVTSRNRFALPGMAALDLGTLPKEEAKLLLLSICPRIGEQTAKLAKLCGELPLALRVSASLLANSSRSVAHYLEQLAAERLKYLSDPDDPQASVEASLRLSYDALERAAQAALAQISVFAASFDLAAALAVLEVEADAEALVDLLVRRSLLEWDEQLQRYSLHDLVRAFAARLKDADAVWLRYARHYAQVAQSADNSYLQGGQTLVAGLVLFDRERTHIDAGWGWAMARAGEQEADALILAFANATAYIGDLRYDKRRERIPHLEAQRAAAQRLGRRDYEGAALGNLGNAYADLGDVRQAIDFYQQHLVIDREIGDRRGEGADLGNLGLAYAALGDARQAIEFHQQALVIDRQLGDRRGEGNALGNLGIAYAALGDARQAIDFYQQALVIDRQIGDRRGEGNALSGLGLAYDSLGDAQRASTFHEQHLAIARQLGDRRGEGAALGNLGLAYADLRDARQAIDFFQQRLVIAREIGDRRGEGNALGNLGSAYYALGDARQAIDFYQQHLALTREIGDRRGEGNALGNLGNAYADLGDARQAIDFYQQQLVIVREIGDRRGEANASWNLGDELAKQGDLARAADLMQVCVEFEQEIGHPDAQKHAAQLEQLRQRLAGGGGATRVGGRRNWWRRLMGRR